ncbi:hypothetical protein F441_10080 [Phytophthora nicotianae CJ01A1]|uniref:Uncharacterized protein n=1 Tax=Phytophthora nicotianae CJ01A1 TaxID=1317063 RepID=W2WY06_PHYNI|nr:hypothetical protein F441_10080 [Phytophthora nicotianae CJ01A1]
MRKKFVPKSNNDRNVAKYSVTELGCLAVVSAEKIFQPHRYGCKLIGMTDYVIWRSLLRTKGLSGHLYRWTLIITRIRLKACVLDRASERGSRRSDARFRESADRDEGDGTGAKALTGPEDDYYSGKVLTSAVSEYTRSKSGNMLNKDIVAIGKVVYISDDDAVLRDMEETAQIDTRQVVNKCKNVGTGDGSVVAKDGNKIVLTAV